MKFTDQNSVFCMTIELCLSSSLVVHDFSNKKLKKLYPDFKFISHFIRNTSDLKLEALFLICGALLYTGCPEKSSDV